MATDYQIPVLLRTIQVIDLIANNKQGITFAEMLTVLDIPKTSLFRIILTLEAENLLSKTGDRYTIGYMLIHFGLKGLTGRNIRTISLPYLQELSNLTTETSHLAIPTGIKSMIVEVCDNKKHIKPSSSIGSLIELYCSAHGKIFLAYNLKENVESIYSDDSLIAKTKHTITSVTDLKREIDLVLTNGYAVDDMEYRDDIRCLAAPILGMDNKILGAIGITATIHDFTADMIPSVAEQVIFISQKISREMGSNL